MVRVRGLDLKRKVETHDPKQRCRSAHGVSEFCVIIDRVIRGGPYMKMTFGIGCAAVAFLGVILETSIAQGPAPPASAPVADRLVLIAKDEAASVAEPGPYKGVGQTTAYRYFDNGEAKALAFRKRSLHPGSSIGPHPVAFEEEVYYILSGRGMFTADGEVTPVSGGTAIMMRPGAIVSLEQTGADDLVMFIAYPRARPEVK